MHGDKLKLKQVVVNLVSNAVKFTPDGGSADVTAHVEGGDVVVSVRDTGVGIAEHEREKLFEAFQRGGRGVRTSTEGTGLGLTLSRQIVELHGGRIWMESRLGKGSTFSVAIPRTPPEPDAPVPPKHRTAADLARHALVVEDDRRSADLRAGLPGGRRLRSVRRERWRTGLSAGARALAGGGRSRHPAAAA